MLLAMIVLSALATLGALTVVSVQGSLKASTADRTQKIATYAAESGAAVAMAYLNQQFRWVTHQSYPGSAPVLLPFPSNGAQPGDPNNLFSPDQHAWYSVSIYNDPVEGQSQPDLDFRMIVESTGHGPQNSMTVIDWEIVATNHDPASSAPRGPMVLLGWHIVM